MEKTPPKEILKRIAAGLGLSMEELLGEDPYTEEEVTAEVLATRLAVP
jgi:hypothetical protein